MRIIIAYVLLTMLFSYISEENNQKHIFYLHGRIIELQGINAVHEVFGKYEYERIIDSLENTSAIIHNELRTEQTDFQEFCQKTSREIDKLIAAKVKPNNITVIGASKGAVMAMNISSMNSNPINYILLAANNEQIEQEQNWNLHGRILGIYEKTDNLAGKNYQHWIDVSTNATAFEQLEINTGLGHAFLYRPIAAWWNPSKQWMEI